jgi:hypothetical protein
MYYDTVLEKYKEKGVSLNGVKMRSPDKLTDMDVPQPKFSEHKHRN